MIEFITVGRLHFTRSGGVITVRWLGHGTTVESDPAPRAPTIEERRALALHLMDGYRWAPL